MPKTLVAICAGLVRCCWFCASVWKFPCFSLQRCFSDEFSWPCTAAMWPLWELHSAHTVFIHRNRNSFFELVNKGEYNWNVKEHRDMCRSVTCEHGCTSTPNTFTFLIGNRFWTSLRSMLMTACDLGAVTKPWEISRKVHAPYPQYTNHTWIILNTADARVLTCVFCFLTGGRAGDQWVFRAGRQRALRAETDSLGEVNTVKSPASL